MAPGRTQTPESVEWDGRRVGCRTTLRALRMDTMPLLIPSMASTCKEGGMAVLVMSPTMCREPS
eukprot:7291197-Alexandrium_andersonii.AAC.1